MVDAVEVGVSLALKGGISVEIARAREEIAQLNAALAVAGVSLELLCQAFARGGAMPRAAPQGVAWPEEGVVAGLTEPLASEDTVPARPAQINATRAQANLHEPSMVTSSGASGLNDATQRASKASIASRPAVTIQHVTTSLERASATMPPAKGAPSDSRQSVPLSTPDERLVAVTTAPRQLPNFASNVAPAVIPTARIIAPIAPAAAMQLASVGSGVASTYGSAELLHLQAGSDQTRGDEQHFPSSRPYLADAGDRYSPMNTFAPQLLRLEKAGKRDTVLRSSQRSDAPGEVTARSDAVSEVASHPAEDSPQGQTYHDQAHGDIFLDGALVGRWISRLLSREAERASVGPTGFDMRRGSLMPGATVG